MTELEKKCYQLAKENQFKFFEHDINAKKYNEQKEKYGFAEYEVWDLNYTVLGFILPRLVFFRTRCLHGAPLEFTEEEWNGILDKIIDGMQLRYFQEHSLSEDEENRVKESYELFAKYLDKIWT